ncbi:hypothetical protein ACFL09_05340, partial [Planctomycetota bacterium]
MSSGTPAACAEALSCLDAALGYASRAWRVLPLHSTRDSGRCTCGKPDCESPGKHPIGSLTPH